MPRALVLHDRTAQPLDRAAVVAGLRRNRERYRAAGCRYWAFEDASGRGRYLEFVEAADCATLERAGATETGAGAPAPMFVELDLS